MAKGELDFLECIGVGLVASKTFAENHQRFENLHKLYEESDKSLFFNINTISDFSRIWVHKEYPGIDVNNFIYAMKVCPGVGNLTNFLQENLKDFPKCFIKI